MSVTTATRDLHTTISPQSRRNSSGADETFLYHPSVLQYSEVVGAQANHNPALEKAYK